MVEHGDGQAGPQVSPEGRARVAYVPTQKLGRQVPMSDEALVEVVQLKEAFDRWWNATPEQREQWAREAAEQRTAEREAAPRVELTLDALLDKLGWSREYAEHVVQPYCECGEGMDGWESCQHARDLGLR